MKITEGNKKITGLVVGCIFEGTGSGDKYLVVKNYKCYKLVNLSKSEITNDDFGSLEFIKNLYTPQKIWMPEEVELILEVK